MTETQSAIETHISNDERGVFSYGKYVIHYDVIRKSLPIGRTNKQPRKVVIRVHPDQRVVATVPLDATEETIRKAMLKRARWIWQNIDEFAKQKNNVLPKHYVSGETQFYLGKRYILKITTDTQEIPSVKLCRGKLNVTLNHLSNKDSETRTKKIKALIDNWYQHKAKVVFRQRLEQLLPRATWIGKTPSFRVLSMKKQWGSCSINGNLVLNPHLVKAPKECIDYVIFHELCHVAEHNHSERFWRLLEQQMPNWKAIKNELDSMAELYLNG